MYGQNDVNCVQYNSTTHPQIHDTQMISPKTAGQFLIHEDGQCVWRFVSGQPHLTQGSKSVYSWQAAWHSSHMDWTMTVDWSIWLSPITEDLKATLNVF